MAMLGNSNGAKAIRVRGVLLIPVMAAFVLARITSYNVCYTKLLRDRARGVCHQSIG